jgi:translation elongation factor aEF-1 beta
MATVYVTLRVMPSSPEADLETIEASVSDLIEDYEANLAKTETKPVAFGLKSIDFTFSMNEDKGDTEDLEEQIEDVDDVQSVQVTDVRRAVG